MKKQCVGDPDQLNWVKFWQEKLENKTDKKKDWDKAAPGFYKRATKDEYKELLLDELILDEEDTVLDLGCGEGSITLPIAEKVKSITGLDSSIKMLEYLREKAEKEDMANVHTIFQPIEDINHEELGNYDVVISSRSLNGVVPIKETLEEMNKIANKYVFITIFGPENWQIETEFNEFIGKEQETFPGYNYIFNILYNMGIYPNTKRLDIKEYRKYDSIEEAMDNGKFRLDLLNDEEKEKLKEYLNRILKKDPETGKLYNKKDKADWVLIWWKKEE